MRRYLFLIVFIIFSVTGWAKGKDGYVVATSEAVRADAAWMKVVDALVKKHKADVIFYKENIGELQKPLRQLRPRFVAFVEKPEFLNREYVMEGHRMSRRVDEDIYADYLWGIIIGVSAEDAMRLVDRSREPFLIRTALNTTCEMSDGKYFTRFAFMNDGSNGPGWWGEKNETTKETQHYQLNKWRILDKWVEKYKELDPDLLVTSSHATEHNLEMPFSVGNLKADAGRLYADFMTREYLNGTSHPRVYFAAGNCLIGNVDNDPNSMAVGWLSGMNATAMVGYVVTTWYGRNGWGGLKYWAANAGRLTLAQAIYLNQQDMLHTEFGWYPEMLTVDYPFSAGAFAEDSEFKKLFRQATGNLPTKDQKGFVHDRDVVVLYGDPAWDVKLKNPAPLGYKVDFKMKGKQCVVTIITNEYFDGALMKGGKLKQEHVTDIPFAYYFPKRVANPRLAGGQKWDIAVAEDFLLLYNCDFEKNKKYTIVLDINE